MKKTIEIDPEKLFELIQDYRRRSELVGSSINQYDLADSTWRKRLNEQKGAEDALLRALGFHDHHVSERPT